MKILYFSFIPALVLTFSTTLSAQRIYVDSAATIGAHNGTSWNDAYTDLQDALGTAISGDSIFVSEGIYIPTTTSDRGKAFVISENIVLLGGFDVANGVTALVDRNPVVHATILSGDINTTGTVTDNSVSVVRTSNANAVIDGFTIRDGYADFVDFGSSQSSRTGGGLYVSGGNVLLRNLVVTDNFAEFQGGGLYITRASGGNGNITISNSTFQNNSTNDTGGGLYSGVISDSVTVSDSRFISNTAREGGGGVD